MWVRLYISWVTLLLLATCAVAERKKGGQQQQKQQMTAATAPVLVSSSVLTKAGLTETTASKIKAGKRLNRRERKELRKIEQAKYVELREAGADEVSNTKESITLRNYKLRNKKRKGLLRKRPSSLADILFPGVAAVAYTAGEPVAVYVDLVESRKRPVPYEYYDLPMCDPPAEGTVYRNALKERKNLGTRLQGRDLQVAPFEFQVLKNVGCTVTCTSALDTKNLRWMRSLITAQYRVQLQLDQLPVLMRSKDYNYAVRGFPLGFQAPENFQALRPGEFYLFNHFRFIVTYHEDSQYPGVRITGFDVHPVSVSHKYEAGSSPPTKGQKIASCNGVDMVDNNPERYLLLQSSGDSMPVVYSYEVQWVASELPWADRWDVYLIGAPDDELHYFSIVNSLMIVLFLTGAISTIMIRTLRKDIAVYNDMDSLEDGSEETGWKLVHGDVFRPPQNSPMLLCVLVGTGAQICTAFGLGMLAAVMKLLNPLQKGQTLTALIILYVLCGSVAGFVSSRLYKYTEQKAWKRNIIMTAVGVPACLAAVFMALNIWLSVVGAATAVSVFTMIKLFLLWGCVSAPMVFIGSFIGLTMEKIEIPTRTNQIARIVPATAWHVKSHYTILMGGILPFGSVCIELAFIMSALWLHQIYYVMGFLLAVLFILMATCAQVSIVLTYLQLCAEDHRWWWTSFWQCASAGLYLFLYSLWFLSSRLEMVGLLPVVIYVTYMGMISICFGLVCGSVGFLSAFWFTRTIYGAVKVD
jgi:transmembrane 9 superfamily member 2/4